MERKSDVDPRIIALGVAVVILAAVVAVVLLFSSSESSDEGPELADACRTAEQPGPKEVDLTAPRPGQTLKKGEKARAVVETSCGSFTIQLDTERAPKTANSFAFLAEQGAYDGTWFHRIVPDFVIQGGDPSGDGTGGPGYSIKERPPKDLTYSPGVVAMAKTGADPAGTSGSQFFIVTGSQGATLPPEYALVGEVTEGMDVVELIGEKGDSSQQPTVPVLIDSVTIERG